MKKGSIETMNHIYFDLSQGDADCINVCGYRKVTMPCSMSNISLQGIGPFFEMRFGYYTHRNNTNIEEMDLEWTGDRTLRKWYCNRDMGFSN
jgi:hypothetical protein